MTQIDARGPQYRLTFSGTWAVGDTYTVDIASSIGDLTLGFGNISKTTPTYGRAVKNKVYLAISSRFAFSASDDATGWEVQDIGAGSIDYNSNLAGADLVQSFSIYQGKLAVFARRSIQIWTVNADPDLYSLDQALENIGTVAPDSVQPLGELEIFFLSDTGVRSLRARDSSLNAFVNDLGSPIDSLLATQLSTLSASAIAAATSIVDPSANRYWLFLGSTIYALSYFPSSKITAWSTYEAKYGAGATITVTDVGAGSIIVQSRGIRSSGAYGSLGSAAAVDTDASTIAGVLAVAINFITGTTGYTAAAVANVVTLTPPGGVPSSAGIITSEVTGNVTSTVASVWVSFTPQKWITHNGQVYARTSTKILRYGWTDNNTYDGVAVTAETPWLDDNAPVVQKIASAVDLAIRGKWVAKLSMDPYSGSLETVATTGDASSPASAKDSTFDKARFGYTSMGTHVKLKFISAETNNAKVLLSGLMFIYNKGRS